AYGPIQSLVFLAVLAICGTRLLRSSILAAGLLAVLPGYASGFDVDRQLLGFGVIAGVAGGLLSPRRGGAPPPLPPPPPPPHPAQTPLPRPNRIPSGMAR